MNKILQFFFSSIIKKLESKSIESVLAKSNTILDSETIEEIRFFLKQKQTPSGAFADRAGNADLYYSLFGYFAAEAVSCNEIIEPLKQYIKAQATKNDFKDVYLYCIAILYSKLIGYDSTTRRFAKQIRAILQNPNPAHSHYTNFLGLLALYYLKDYWGIARMLWKLEPYDSESNKPCSVLAAELVIQTISRKPNKQTIEKLMSFHHEGGGFVAVKHAPIEDLLSTSVALFSLLFAEADIRMIKPDCLTFIDGLYLNGGFRALEADFEIDVEYTFYGLLGLGALI